MTWLITGGSGQLGIAVSQELGKRGLLFHAWSSKDLNITQGPIVRDFVLDLSPKLIINCAAWTDVDGAETNELEASRVNGDGAENLALAAKNCGAKLIHDTLNCLKYEKDRVPKKTFKSQKGKSPVNTKIDRQSFKTMEDNLKKVRTDLKKMKKRSHKSKKRKHDDLSETSNNS
jgi:dTDP-4-dehydrorhamnose reductase